MRGFCVCCDEHKTIDPEDGHCWACASGRCGGEHDDDEEQGADDHDDDVDDARRAEWLDERWLDEQGL